MQLNAQHPSHDLRRRRVVVTGATSGVGLALVEALTARGASVVMAVRDLRAAERLCQERFRDHEVDCVELDLADLASVRVAAKRLTSTPIDALVNNAATAGARGTTKDGFEMAFGTNHLGHYLLTRLLLPSIRGRIVHVGSGSHRSVDAIDWRRCTAPTQSWTGIREYAMSKLAVTLFHHELTRRLARTRTPISLWADPGNVASNAYRHIPTPFRQLWTLGMKSPRTGAATPLFAVQGAVLPGAAYVDGAPTPTSLPSRSIELGRELWQRSAEWVGVPDALADGGESR